MADTSAKKRKKKKASHSLQQVNKEPHGGEALLHSSSSSPSSPPEFFKVPDKLDNTDNFHKLEKKKNEVVVWGTSSGPLVSCGQH